MVTTSGQSHDEPLVENPCWASASWLPATSRASFSGACTVKSQGGIARGEREIKTSTERGGVSLRQNRGRLASHSNGKDWRGGGGGWGVSGVCGGEEGGGG